MPKLIATDEAGAVTEHEVSAGTFTIGRAAECNIVVLETGVSREHAVVEYDGEKLTVSDNQSHNGTLVNGERVERAELSDGDEIKVGETTMKVVMDTAVAAPAEAGTSERPERKDRKARTERKGRGKRRKARTDRKLRKELKDRDEVSSRDVEDGVQVAGEDAKERKKKHSSRRKKAVRETADGSVPLAPDGTKTTRRKRELFGGMRLSEQQQLIVKVASVAVIVLSLIGMGWLLVRLTEKRPTQGRRIVYDPRAEPERLSEQACVLARQARDAEDRRDLGEAFRLIDEAKAKAEEADRLYTKLAQKYEGDGYKYIQKMARKIKVRARTIREEHFRLDMQRRRYGN